MLYFSCTPVKKSYILQKIPQYNMIELPLLGRQKRKSIAPSKIEYVDLAANPVFGCSHACTYCYSRKMQLQYKQASSKAEWHKPKLYDGFFERLKEQLDTGLIGPDREIFVASMTDVYQPAAFANNIGRKLIGMLQDYGARYRLLTKSPDVAQDADLFDGYKNGVIGLSITTDINNPQQKKWEPRTRPIKERLEALGILSNYDIRLWSSVEPVLPGTNTLQLFTDLIKYSNVKLEQIMVGKMNYEAGTDDLVDWKDTLELLEDLRVGFPTIHFHYKKETVNYLDRKGWIKEFNVNLDEVLNDKQVLMQL